MKRLREDSSFGPHLKRPASVSGESSEPVQTATTSQGVTTEDALQYLKAVKDRFKDDKEKYDDFLEVMKHFKAKRIDTAGVIARVKDLFRGHPRLIIGFNTFLPKGYEITLPLEEEARPPPKKQPVEFDQAINYVNKIKTRFEHDEQVYKAFLEILNMYRKGNKSISEVYQEVASLFQLHVDLLEEFTYFLPDSTGHVNVSAPLSSKPSSSVRRDDKSTVMGAARHAHSERVVKREKVEPFHVDDRGIERSDEQEVDHRSLKVEKEQRRKIEKEREKKEECEHKEVIKTEKESELENDQRLPHKRKSARRADELIRKQSQVGEGGETFAGPSASAPLVDEKMIGKCADIQNELVFFEKVKMKLRTDEPYQELLKCLDLYSKEIISRSELRTLLEDILGKHEELLEGFNEIFSRCESIGEDSKGYIADVVGRRAFEMVDAAVVIERDKERDKERHRDRERERDRDRDKQREREREREREKDKDREKEKERDKERERDKVTPHHIKDGANHKISLLPPKERYMNKPISELDLSNSESCTPSYRLLPKNYPKPLSSHRTGLGVAVLNDSWVSVTSGSEDYSFKHMRKNHYEESLFCCEDDRFELDMLLESTAVTANRVGEMVESISDLIKPETQFSLDDHLSAINLRCIERIYGDHGLDILDLLRKNPAVALPVIHARLKQKHEEWLKCRVDMNKVWSDVYSKNYHKSLDHRSFYFKQQDKKSLSTKGLLTEIKDINEKKRGEDNTMLLLAVGNQRPLIPDLKFEYVDSSVHEELYQIIKYSADEVCNSTEQYEKVLRIWTTFIEPMFGVPPHPHGAEDTEEAVKIKAPESEQSSSSAGESATTGADGTDKTTNQLADGMDPRNVASAALDEFAIASSKVKAERRNSAAVSLADDNASIMSPAVSILKEDEGEQSQKNSKENLQIEIMKSKVPIPIHSEKDDMRKQLSHFEQISDTRIKQSLGTDTASSRRTSDCMERNEKHGKLEAVNLGRSSGSRAILSQRKVNETNHEVKQGDLNLPSGDIAKKSSGRGDEDKRVGYSEDTVTHKCEFKDQSRRIEREEGELSPSPEAEERDTTGICSDKMTSGTTNYLLGQLMKDCKSNKDLGISHGDDDEPDADGDVGGDHDADADDEGEDSAQKSTEDSENISEAGDEVSGSASGDNDDASHEDNEEEDDEDEEQEGKVESEGEAEGMADAEDGEGEGFSMASVDRSLARCKPLAAHATSLDIWTPSKGNVIFYGNDMFYILFRLYQTLYERILSAKTNAIAVEQKWKPVKDASAPDLYTKFLRVLYNLLDGTTENAMFEDECRALIGTQSYILFTLDKLIYKLVKQLQAVASDDMANKLMLLHAHEKSRGAEGMIDIVYHANACVLLHDESVFRFEHVGQKACPSELSIQLMDGGPEKLEVPATAIDNTFQSYLHDYLLSVPERKDRHRVFAERNKPKFTDDEESEAFTNAMRGVHVINGLECKIACNTSKVSYVLDTEDLLHRRKKRKTFSSLDVSKSPHNIPMMCGSTPPLNHRDKVEQFLRWLNDKLREER